MKIKYIKSKFKQAKELLAEHSMLDEMISSMLKLKKKCPEDYTFDEKYYQSIIKRIEQIKKDLENLFK